MVQCSRLTTCSRRPSGPRPRRRRARRRPRRYLVRVVSDSCRHATRSDFSALLETMVGGFHDDPLYEWLYRDPSARPGQLRDGFELVLACGLLRGHLYTNVGRSAVAIWTAPDVELMDVCEAEAFLRLIRSQIGARVDEVAAGLSALTSNRPNEPHFTLHNVVVRTDAQGHGVGAALLAPVLARCDEDGLLACLDSSNPRNVPFYERLGFELAAETPLVRSMVRSPR